MEAGNVVTALIGAALFVCLVYILFWQVPKRLDRQIRTLLVDYKKWIAIDDRHDFRLREIAKKRDQLGNPGEDNLDFLRLERARIKSELDRLEGLNTFLGNPESEAEQKKYEQLKQVENRIDEHPDRERELEDTRSRLVARMRDVRRYEAEHNDDQ